MNNDPSPILPTLYPTQYPGFCIGNTINGWYLYESFPGSTPGRVGTAFKTRTAILDKLANEGVKPWGYDVPPQRFRYEDCQVGIINRNAIIIDDIPEWSDEYIRILQNEIKRLAAKAGE